jgi:flagellar biosynthesis GTPase FlhF
MSKKNVSEIRKKILEEYEKNEYAHVLQNQTRARSFSVGTAFGGSIEVSMRGDHSNLWCILQPVEAVEFIEQLAAAAGLQVALRPKNDFSTWRGWDIENADRYWIGSAPWNVPQLSNQINESKMLNEVSEEMSDQLKEIQDEHVENNKNTLNEIVESQKNFNDDYAKDFNEERKIKKEISEEMYKEFVEKKHQTVNDIREEIGEYVNDNLN